MPGSEPAPPHSLRRWIWLAAAVPALGAMIALFLSRGPQRASAQVRSVAVLPAAGADPQWLSDGLTGEVIDELTRFPALHVVAPASALQAAKEPRDLRKAGERLGVQAVLELTIKPAGEGLRVAANLTRAADGYPLWTETFRGRRQDAPMLPAKIAAALAQRVGVGGSGQPRARGVRKLPETAAYDAYLEGRAVFDRGGADACSHAVERFGEATGAAADFGPAWAGLSIALACRADEGLVRPNSSMPGARDAAERAVALDPGTAAGHLALAIVKLQYDWEWAGAKDELTRALQLSPGSAVVPRWIARWDETQGRLAEAREETARAKALDPLSGADPAPSPFATAEDAARRGDDTESHRLLDQAEDLRAERYIPAAAFSGLAAADQDWDALFAWLEVEYNERSVRLPYARTIPGIPRSDPRFTDLLERMNLPVAADH